jgi:sec-independent protein translocase protein TatA
VFGLGFGELILIFLIALIFIGPKKLPELAKGLGQGIKEFQKAAKGLTDQMNDTTPETKPVQAVVETKPLENVTQHNEFIAPIETPVDTTEKKS